RVGKRNDPSFESPKRDDATRRRDFDRVFKRLPRRGEDWRESSTPPPQTTSPLLVSPRSASPRLASPTVNHLRSPCQKSASHARRFAARITRLASGKRMTKGPDGPTEGTKKDADRLNTNYGGYIDRGICSHFSKRIDTLTFCRFLRM
ncbi:hypothetical protein ALC57_12372, partial [Trachymyrmex cornetzi]